MHKQTLIIDTGSGLTVFPCQDCGDCGKNHLNSPFFMMNRNSDGLVERPPLPFIKDRNPRYGWSCDYFEDEKDPKCSFYISYYEGSEYAGYFIHESLVFEHELARAAVEFHKGDRLSKYGALIGCVSQESGTVKDQRADGIIGLGLTANCKKRIDLATDSPPDIVSIAFSQGRVSKNVFSLCLASNNGYITIGEYDSSSHMPLAKYETLDFNRSLGQYQIKLAGIKVGLSVLPFAAEQLNEKLGVFIDSGASLIYGPSIIIQ